MTNTLRLFVIGLWAAGFAWLTVSGPSSAQTKTPQTNVAKIWDAEKLATWAVPVAGINAKPGYMSEAEYYALPEDNLRTYPVYHPDREPAGYRAWLKRQGAQPLIQPQTLRREQDWIAAGRRVFDELDVPEVRTADPQILAYVNDRAALKADGLRVTKDGQLPALRWVVERDGQLKLSLPQCAACHLRVLPDGSVIRGAQGNENLNFRLVPQLFGAGVERAQQRGRKPLPPNENAYAAYAVPWRQDDIHLRLKTMNEAEVGELESPPLPGVVTRFNGSPYYIAKIPDLIGLRERKYIDHTGTHLNRGPEDIARYAILVTSADSAELGPHRFLTSEQRVTLYRFSDAAMYALGKFLYALTPPPNPNRVDALAARGQQVFKSEGCAQCHTPPLYTNNKLTPVEGFTPPPEHLQQFDILNLSVGTDPGLALKTRKGTGYYKVPSLRGLWYRGLLEHSGSVASLAEWFDPRRLRDDYVPDGWKGPGVTTRAVKGHEFGLQLSAADKRALIAFLKTL